MVYSDDLPRLACKDFEQDLVLYYYGEIAGADHDRVGSHLQDCSLCQRFLQDLRVILPLTTEPDEPPQAFWDRYAKEMRAKLSEAEKKTPWWRGLSSLWNLRPWPVPVLATASVLIVALSLNYFSGTPQSEKLSSQNVPPPDVASMVENLDFFKSLEFVESIDLLESLEGTESRQGSV